MGRLTHALAVVVFCVSPLFQVLGLAAIVVPLFTFSMWNAWQLFVKDGGSLWFDAAVDDAWRRKALGA